MSLSKVVEMVVIATRVVISRSTADSMIREKQAKSIQKLETTITAEQSTTSKKNNHQAAGRAENDDMSSKAYFREG